MNLDMNMHVHVFKKTKKRERIGKGRRDGLRRKEVVVGEWAILDIILIQHCENSRHWIPKIIYMIIKEEVTSRAKKKGKNIKFEIF